MLDNAEAAFEMMLPAETKKVAYLAEESAFFSNQCYKESRRVIMQDYAIARYHFVDMGEQMHRHIYDLNMQWGQFLDFYTDLNNARKERDDKYVENECIGEEVIEPDEKESPFSSDLVHDDGDEETGDLLSALKEEIKDEEKEEAKAEEEATGAMIINKSEIIEQ